MWKKIAIGGAVAAAIVGIGTASLAVTGDTAPTPGTGSTSSANPSGQGGPAARARNHPRLAREIARRTVHGQVVTQNPKTKEFVTHDVISGSVTSVSSTSITVKAADNTSFTYTVNADTKVRTRTAGKPGSGAKGSIGDVKVGDKVFVTGTGASSPFTAKWIVDGVA